MKVEDVFSSKLRIKILRILVQMRELNVSDIARRLNVNYVTTSRHLIALENEEVITHKSYGRIRLYRLNEQSPKARAIESMIEVWEQTEDHQEGDNS